MDEDPETGDGGSERRDDGADVLDLREDHLDTFDLDGETTVRRLGFGAMRLCGPDILGAPDDEAGARAVLRRAVDAGVDFVDTADAYGPGTSERLIGETLDLEGADADVTVATKAGLLRAPDGDWILHGDPDYVRNQALAALDRLGTDRIDLFQLHQPDPDVRFEETLAAFADLQDRGLVEHVGLSNVSVDQLQRAREVVDVATVQNRYNVGDREHEPVLRACEEHQIGFVPYFPLGPGGFGAAESVVQSVADARGATREQVALAWLLEHSPVLVPIPGTSSMEHLVENVRAARVELTDEDVRRLDDAASGG